MRIVTVAELTERDMARFGSRGFRVGALGNSLHGTAATLAAGGQIGAHPAAGPQAFVVVQGRVRVEGDGETTEIGPGQVALWALGENHRTEALTDVAALIIEHVDVLS